MDVLGNTNKNPNNNNRDFGSQTKSQIETPVPSPIKLSFESLQKVKDVKEKRVEVIEAAAKQTVIAATATSTSGTITKNKSDLVDSPTKSLLSLHNTTTIDGDDDIVKKTKKLLVSGNKKGPKVAENKPIADNTTTATTPAAVITNKTFGLGKNPEQSILNALRQTCYEKVFKDPQELQFRAKKIKQLFYDRDFDSIFLDTDNLPAYIAMYTPRRALCYYNMFINEPELAKLFVTNPRAVLEIPQHQQTQNRSSPQLPIVRRVCCLGGGSGSEMLGISAMICHNQDIQVPRNQDQQAPTTNIIEPLFTIHTQDYADWTSILTNLEQTIKRKWKKLNDPALINYEYSKSSLLDIDSDLEKIIASSDLVTVMFVFNELFSDKSKSMEFIKLMIKCLRKGSYLLVSTQSQKY
ncbi:hypothetical protein H4219_005992 [Mycoemilia scoparia]|uniref:Uncharacterized protein n=1 Tax=Mycoemilia scoparia TaxID=417184 RepID=A0A9W7ZM55_9FUNG|nr:hypothetical protein H4219_005992 [Mycoemilia scoparia]